MTNLTEQFLNDEIDESKLYYFKQKMSEEIEVGTPFSLNMVRALDGTYLDWFLIDEVLAEVPSYEQWSQIYKTEFEFLEEITKLKELLESALSWLDLGWLPDSSKIRGGRYAQFQNLKRKIKEMLGKEEEQWLENNPNRQCYADFEDCPEFKKKEQKDVEMATKTEQSGCSKRL